MLPTCLLWPCSAALSLRPAEFLLCMYVTATMVGYLVCPCATLSWLATDAMQSDIDSVHSADIGFLFSADRHVAGSPDTRALRGSYCACVYDGSCACPSGVATSAGRGAVRAAAAAGATLSHSHPGQARQTGDVKPCMRCAYINLAYPTAAVSPVSQEVRCLCGLTAGLPMRRVVDSLNL